MISKLKLFISRIFSTKYSWVWLLLLVIGVLIAMVYGLSTVGIKIWDVNINSYPQSYPIVNPVKHLEVSLNAATQNMKYRRAQFIATSNKEITEFKLPAKWAVYTPISLVPQTEKHTYIIETNNIGDGRNHFVLEFIDADQEVVSIPVKLIGKPNRPAVSFWPGADFYADPENLLAIANKKYRLPMSFQPTDLVDLDELKITNFNDSKLRRPAAEALQQMVAEIKKAKIDYKVTSGFRSYSAQVSVYNYWLDLSKGDVAYTDSFSARPGHSEHQLGTTLDFVTIESGDKFFKFEETRLSKWLAKNAYKYGFAMSYPNGKQDITGYNFEPWHYRYIGIENATDFRASKLTLTEWLYEKHGIN